MQVEILGDYNPVDFYAIIKALQQFLNLQYLIISEQSVINIYLHQVSLAMKNTETKF